MKKRANGEGTIYNTIQKNKRKIFLEDMCSICKQCEQKCNRTLFEKCEKCSDCKECLNYCDRYYCYKVTKSQITVNKQRKSSGTGKNSTEAKQKKEETSHKLRLKELMTNGDLTLSETMRTLEENKLKAGLKENSYNRNISTISLIENYNLAYFKMSEITKEDFVLLMTTLVEQRMTQSCIDKVYDEIHQACKYCNIDNYVFNNITRSTFFSDKEPEEVTAFTVEEENKILQYINSNENNLVNSNKCNIDSKTIKNIIKFGFATGMRIGEICSLDKNDNINMENKRIIVKHTLTKDINNNIVIGNSTKTGRKKRQKNKRDIRYVPFNILFESEEVEDIIKEQKELSTSNLLFSDKNGEIIAPSSINNIFKRICKEINIQKNCKIHMLKHTAVTRMVENGIDIYVISEIVGTSVRVLSNTYAHILNDFIDKEIEKSKNNRKSNNISLNNESKIKGKIIQFKAYC